MDMNNISDAELKEIEALEGYEDSCLPAISRNTFDYSSVDEAAANKAREAVTRIRERTQASIIETGKDLLAVKDALGHGKFGEWLRFHFTMTERTAESYMNVAREFGEFPRILDILPAATVYKLASKNTPDKVKRSVVDEINSGAVPHPKSIEKRIVEAKLDDKQSRVVEREWKKERRALKESGRPEEEVEAARKQWEVGFRARLSTSGTTTSSTKTISNPKVDAFARVLRNKLGTDFDKYSKVLISMMKPEYRAVFQRV